MFQRVADVIRSPSTDLWLGYVARIWGQLAYFAFFVFAGRILAPDAFGVYALASIFIILGQSCLYTGPYQYIISAQTIDDAKGATLALQIAIALLGVCIMAVIAIFADAMFETSGVSILILAFTPALLVASVTAWMEAFILRAKRLRRYYAALAIADTISIAAGIVALILDFGVYALVVYRYIGLLIVFVIYATSSVPFVRPVIDRVKIGKIMRFGSGLYGSLFASSAITYSADIIIGFLLNPAAVAYYRMSSRLVNAVTDIAGQPARTVGWSMMASVERNTDELAEVWPKFFLVFFIIVASAFGCIAILSTDLIALLLGPSWAPMTDVVIALCAVRALSSFGIVAMPVFGAKNRNGLAFKIRLVEFGLIVVGLLLFAGYGPAAAAWGQAPAALFVAIACWAALIKITGPAKSTRVEMLTAPLAVVALTVAALAAGRLAADAVTSSAAVISVVGLAAAAIVWIGAVRFLAWKSLFKPIFSVWRETPA